MRRDALCLIYLGLAAAFNAHEASMRPPLLRPRSVAVLALPVGSRLPEETIRRLQIAGRRAVVYFCNGVEEDKADLDMLTAAEAQASKLSGLGFTSIVIPQQMSIAKERCALTLMPDGPFKVDAKDTTLVREFAVQPYATFSGPVPGRASFAIDSAGYVRGTLVEQKNGALHASAMRQCAEAMEANAKVVEAEMAFNEQAVIDDDGMQQRPIRLSAVGRMRAKQAQKAEERGQGPGWDEELTKKLNTWADKLFS
mmetsp:Transcript_53462/g.106353  ORF Transcript_53462/g.106353 Transcript_53462/m.106353 type:complete len:254 (-) Transcript_53462:331-1092(-)